MLRRTERAQREDRSNRLQFWTLLNCTYSWKHCICIKVCLSPLFPSFLLFLSSADLINIFFCLVTMAMRSVDMMLNWIFPELLCSLLCPNTTNLLLILVFLSALVLHFVYAYAFSLRMELWMHVWKRSVQHIKYPQCICNTFAGDVKFNGEYCWTLQWFISEE